MKMIFKVMLPILLATACASSPKPSSPTPPEWPESPDMRFYSCGNDNSTWSMWKTGEEGVCTDLQSILDWEAWVRAIDVYNKYYKNKRDAKVPG